MNKKYVAVFIVLIIVIIGQSYFSIQLQNNYSTLQNNYSQLSSSYDTLDTSYSSLQIQFDALREQVRIQINLGYAAGYAEGYVQGVIEGAGRGYTLRDPTYSEVLSFVAENHVDQNPYNGETYNCANFAGDFKNDAFKAGYRCGYVSIDLAGSGHAIVCFDTIERGVIYLEPQDDEIVTLVVGQPYWNRTKYNPTYDDPIIRFITIW